MKYKINQYNNNYIIITTTTIIKKHYEYINNANVIWHKLYSALKNASIPAISPIAIEKNTIEAQIIMNELQEEEKNITMEELKNACIIAAYKGDNFAGHLSYIVLTNPQVNNFGTTDEFAEKYGLHIANFILHNNSIQNYYDQTNGKSPNEHDKNVFLYENGALIEKELPVSEKNKTRKKHIN